MNKVVIDIYGADGGPLPILRGTAEALAADQSLFAVFVGDEKTVTDEMERLSVSRDRYSVIHTEKAIENCDNPTDIFKGHSKENCSMGLALDALCDDPDCAGLLSAGSTGALLIGSIFRLGLTKGLKMPALSTSLPCVDGEKFVCLVDCGANVDCKAKNLCDFALLGNAFAKSMYGIKEPRIALMSVGREKGKGNNVIKEAYDMLSALPINFIGNVEGSDLLSGYADVIVTDGYAGNLLLKNAEAIGKYAASLNEALCEKYGVCEEFKKEMRDLFSHRLDFNSHGGATFLGTKKTVIKMHGSANSSTVRACIEQMKLLHERHFDSLIADAITTQ